MAYISVLGVVSFTTVVTVILCIIILPVVIPASGG